VQVKETAKRPGGGMEEWGEGEVSERRGEERKGSEKRGRDEPASE